MLKRIVITHQLGYEHCFTRLRVRSCTRSVSYEHAGNERLSFLGRKRIIVRGFVIRSSLAATGEEEGFHENPNLLKPREAKKKKSKNELKREGNWEKGKGATVSNRASASSSASAKATIEIQSQLTKSFSLEEIFEIVRERSAEFDSINASTALHRIASKGTKDVVENDARVRASTSSTSVSRVGRRSTTSSAATTGFERRRSENEHPYERIIRNKDFENLMQSVEDNVNDMDQFGLANVAWSLARLRVLGNEDGVKDDGEKKMLDLIARNFAECVQRQGGASVRPQAFSNFMWAYGSFKYKIHDENVLKKIYDQLEISWAENADAWKPQEMANLLVGVAHANNATDKWSFYEKVQDCAIGNLKTNPLIVNDRNADQRFSFTARDISNFLWGLSKSLKSQKFNAQSIDSELISLMLQRLVAENFGGKQSALNVSMTVWALANCKCPVPPRFMEVLNQEIPRMAKRLSASQLDAIAWSIGEAKQTLQYDNDAIDAVAEAIAENRESVYNESDPELVAKIFWALSRRGRVPADKSIIDKLVKKVELCSDDLERSDKLLILHAWGVLRISPGEKVVNKLVRTFVEDGEDSDDDHGDELEPDECAKLLCAYGRIDYKPSSNTEYGMKFEKHLQKLAKTLADSAEASRLNPGTLALGLWGCALLKLKLDEDVLDLLARDALRQTDSLKPNSFAKCVFALATLAYDPTQDDLAKLVKKAQQTIFTTNYSSSSDATINNGDDGPSFVANESTKEEVRIALIKLGADSLA